MNLRHTLNFGSFLQVRAIACMSLSNPAKTPAERCLSAVINQQHCLWNEPSEGVAWGSSKAVESGMFSAHQYLHLAILETKVCVFFSRCTLRIP